MADYTMILENLKDNYLFKLSLGSKELFHSNFLEMLWELDKKKFVDLLRELTGNNNLLPKFGVKNTLHDDNNAEYQVDYYTLSREKENFDICIYHLEQKQNKKNKKYQKPKEVYDLIIENKVKSVPHKVQLKEYCDKVSKKNGSVSGCTFILLSLMESFTEKDLINTPDPDDPNWTPWKIKNYSELCDAIKKCYPENDNSLGEYKEIILKYLDFIKDLHELQGKIKQNFDSAPLFDEKTIDEFKKYRLHDLYIKLSCGLFVDSLKQRLQEKLFDKKVKIGLWANYNYKKIRKEVQNSQGPSLPYILLHEEMLQAAGSVGVSILPRWKEEDPNKDFYEIIIQNGQYRHCINRIKRDGMNTEGLLWNDVWKFDYLNKVLDKDLQEKYQSKAKDYCVYSGDDLYLYRYASQKDIPCENVLKIIDFMTEDIIKTCRQFKIIK